MKFKKFLALLFATFIIFSSCTTPDDVYYVSSRPTWIKGVADSTTVLNYLIVVNSSTKEDLYEEACNIFVKKFTLSLSIEDKSDEYVESLINTLGIEDYQIYNTKRYYEKISDESYKGYFLFTASKSKVSSATASRISKVTSTNASLTKLIDQSNSYYRNNRDLKSFETLVSAYILSRDNNISSSSSNSSEKIMNRLLKLIKNMTVKVANFDENTLNCNISVSRNVGLFPPIILDSNLKISYSSYNALNKPYLDVERITIPYKLSSYKFIPRNTSVYKRGVLLIEVDIDDSLSKLRKSGYQDAARVLEENNKSYVISYNNDKFFENKIVSLSILENDLNQVPITPISTSRIIDALKSLGADVVEDTGDESLEVPYDYKITFRNEITDKIEGFKSTVRSAGSVEVEDLSKGIIIYDSEPFECVAYGDDMDSAIVEVFERFALKSIFYLKENF